MSLRLLLTPILDDEHLTRGLGDEEARMLVEWLVERTEAICADDASAECAQSEVARRCRRARAISRFVALWCHRRQFAAATQLAASERFPWPLPAGAIDACDLMSDILVWEEESSSSANDRPR